MKTYLFTVVIGFFLLSVTACQPITQIARVEGTAAQPIETFTTASDARAMIVEDVQVQVGVGSPIPLDLFVSGTWPDLCAQLTAIRQRITGFDIAVTILTTPEDSTCPPDRLGLPFRIAIPINGVQLSEGTYTVAVNGVSTDFAWPATNPASEPAVQGARQVLARWLHIDPATVEVISAEATAWPDGCLGVPDPLALCAPGVVPGYAATLQANGQWYNVHTDQGGYRLRVAAAPEPAIGEPLITWTGGDNVTGACLEAVIGSAGIGFAPCHLPPIGGKFATAARQAMLNEFVNTFAAFTAETASGDIQFMGQGATVATTAEQQQIAVWTQNAIYEAQAGGPLAWLHYRGLAEAGNVDNATCPDLRVSEMGSVTLGVCDGSVESKTLGERAAVDWGEIGDRFASFTYTTPNESLEFSGMGTISGAAWQRGLLAWARVTYADLNSGTVSAASNTAISWHLGQLPNTPNTCAHLTVLAYGYAYAEQIACEGGDVVASISGWLTNEEMVRLDGWLYQRAAFYQENNYIDGRGTVPLSAAEGSEAAQWAAALYVRLMR